MKKPIFAHNKNKALATYKKLLKSGFRFFTGHQFVGKELRVTFDSKNINSCHYVSLYRGAVIVDLFWDGEIEAHIRSNNLKKHLETFTQWEKEERSSKGN